MRPIRIGGPMHAWLGDRRLPWDQVPVPPKDHECWVQTTGLTSDGKGSVVEKCPCGGTRLDGGEWFWRNTRPPVTSPREDSDWPRRRAQIIRVIRVCLVVALVSWSVSMAGAVWARDFEGLALSGAAGAALAAAFVLSLRLRR